MNHRDRAHRERGSGVQHHPPDTLTERRLAEVDDGPDPFAAKRIATYAITEFAPRKAAPALGELLGI